MNNILKIFISLLFFLLLITTAGQEEYASVKSSFFQKSNVTLFLSANTKSHKKDHGFLFINRFADMPQYGLLLLTITLPLPVTNVSCCCLLF